MRSLCWLSRERAPNAFPPASEALTEPNGLLAAGGDLSPERLLAAYKQGIFPWYQEGQPILWWSPDPRAVLWPDSLKVSREAYGRLHRLGWAHSFETWADGVLVGGLYGVAVGRAFFGESMFTRVADASKVALVHAVDFMRERRIAVIDCQVASAHTRSLGAVEIPRREFLALIKQFCGESVDPATWRSA
jgi:leucyl/phenylalanyl-tRNA--protein transferase